MKGKLDIIADVIIELKKEWPGWSIMLEEGNERRKGDRLIFKSNKFDISVAIWLDAEELKRLNATPDEAVNILVQATNVYMNDVLR